MKRLTKVSALVLALSTAFVTPVQANVGGLMPNIASIDTSGIMDTITALPKNLAELDLNLDQETTALLQNLVSMTQESMPKYLTLLEKVSNVKDFNGILQVAEQMTKNTKMSVEQQDIIYNMLYDGLTDYIKQNGMPSLEYLKTLNITPDTVNGLKQVIAQEKN